MSYSFRNRPKLSDRYRGKSGDEILNELKNQIDEDRKMFFESSPDWNSVQSPGSFSRAGHPLDDMMSRGRQDIRSHLDDLAQRHPEFADHLRCPPWGGEMGASSRGTWGKKRRGSGSSGDDATNQESPMPECSEEASPSRGRSRQNNLPQYGLRNTVDLGQQQQQQQCEDQEKTRGQRSWSAPPDNRTQNPPDPPRFVSRLDIPVNPMPNNPGPDQGKPPVAPKQQPSQQPQQPRVPQQTQQPPNTTNKASQQPGSNVRHIPIFVEGRDEPLLPKAAAGTGDAPTERIFTERVPPQPTTFNYGRPSYFTARQNQQHPSPQMSQTSPQMPQQTAYSQQATPPRARTFAQQQQVPPHHQPPPPPPPQQPKQENTQQQEQSKGAPHPHKQPVGNDPISRVQAIQKDVNELKLKVDNYSGNSRKDKDYMYLDEMLTRNLLKLDNIETEGKDDVRQARKAAIRNIQQCISILESKVPSPVDVCQNSSEDVVKWTEHNGEQSSEQVSGMCPESEIKTTEVCSESSVPQDSQVISGQKMEVENLPQTEVAESSSQSGLAMETEPVEAVNESTQKAKLESDSQEGMVSKQPEKDLAPQDSEKSENVSNKEADSCLQQSDMKVDEKTVTGEQLQEQMEVNTLCGKDIPPVPAGDEKATGSSLTVDGSPNKASKTKSPKGSPKKGKRTT
ncbi:hypothetical protein R5R35_002312 [Gryllus longicercus]|uniref:BAG domain-containing protein n=1 Tax=Gryllus longicercus TaxID=2509291 RepID=A0AAN9W584_9ORTH